MLDLKGVAQIHFSIEISFSQKVFWAWVHAALLARGVLWGNREEEGWEAGTGEVGTVVRELRVDTQTEAQENTADGEWAPPSWTAAAPPSRPQRQPLTAVPAPPGSSCLLGPDLAQTNVGPCPQIQTGRLICIAQPRQTAPHMSGPCLHPQGQGAGPNLCVQIPSQ